VGWFEFTLAVLNVFQAIALAWLAGRVRSNGRSSSAAPPAPELQAAARRRRLRRPPG